MEKKYFLYESTISINIHVSQKGNKDNYKEILDEGSSKIEKQGCHVYSADCDFPVPNNNQSVRNCKRKYILHSIYIFYLIKHMIQSLTISAICLMFALSHQYS